MKKRAIEGGLLAALATPGPWRDAWDDPHHTTFDESVAVASEAPAEALDPPDQLVVGTLWHDGLHSACRKVDATFIADARTRVPALAADVLALIAENERLTASREEARQERDEFGRDVERITKERDALKAEVERLRAVVAACDVDMMRPPMIG